MSNFGPSEFGPAVFGGDPSGAWLLHDVDAELTSVARRFVARGTMDGTTIQMLEFKVGQGGVDPFDYEVAIPVNPDAQDLELPLDFPLVGPQPLVFGGRQITENEQPHTTAVSFYCLVPPGELSEVLSEIGIWAQVKCSPSDTEVGDFFLAAIAHFPIVCKNDSMAYAFRVCIQL